MYFNIIKDFLFPSHQKGTKKILKNGVAKTGKISIHLLYNYLAWNNSILGYFFIFSLEKWRQWLYGNLCHFGLLVIVNFLHEKLGFEICQGKANFHWGVYKWQDIVKKVNLSNIDVQLIAKTTVKIRMRISIFHLILMPTHW